MSWPARFVIAAGVLALAGGAALARDSVREERTPPEPSVAPTMNPDPAPLIAPPPGIYYVTDTYVADVVTTTGALTTYTTATIHQSTGSWARVLETVGTGTQSSFDGLAFNGRRALNDGRAVAGTYYENFVLTPMGFVPVSIVFFQDDAEMRRMNPTTPAAPTPRRTSPSTPSPAVTPACCAPARTSAPIMVRRTPPPPSIEPRISLAPTGVALDRIEVLRGRPIAIWLRAFVNGREVPVRRWSVVSGEAGDAYEHSGPGSEAFSTSWPRLAPPGMAYQLTFRLEVDTSETGPWTVTASLSVVVRSPALEE